ncbi:hypothetical protein [Breoghania sp. JC706]|uniref:hypothetical protein n=1 Tax=Breoghania sp. JC706 TaxID=3117732 RepID=UPI00300AD6A3
MKVQWQVKLTADELKSALRSANRTRAPGNCDSVLKEATAASGKFTHDEVIARNRAVTE